ncbi:unnamed protein product [Schistocephalus solidus]|uniref:Uncharacterized protein n=1 Tax=Schistocephalus solidus TaxID=70667 RepID=A0A183SPK9_SCHSO|nr:unnamed protein product [Schistocephalus solidus]
MAAILQQLSSDPARAIDAHSMAVFLLCPNPEARFSLPAQLASHLLPVTDISPMAPSFSLRYTRAISALMGYMQPCLVSSQDTERAVQPAPFEPLILRKFLEDNFKTSLPPRDLTRAKTAVPTSHLSRLRPTLNSERSGVSGQCNTPPVPSPPSQRQRLLLQTPAPPVTNQPPPKPSNPSTPLLPIAPKPAVFALRSCLPPSSTEQSLTCEWLDQASNISSGGFNCKPFAFGSAAINCLAFRIRIICRGSEETATELTGKFAIVDSHYRAYSMHYATAARIEFRGPSVGAIDILDLRLFPRTGRRNIRSSRRNRTASSGINRTTFLSAGGVEAACLVIPIRTSFRWIAVVNSAAVVASNPLSTASHSLNRYWRSRPASWTPNRLSNLCLHKL